MYLHSFGNKEYQKRIHKTGCWNIPAKSAFLLCQFGKTDAQNLNTWLYRLTIFWCRTSFQHYAYVWHCIKDMRDLFLLCFSFFIVLPWHKILSWIWLTVNRFQFPGFPNGIYVPAVTQAPDILIMSKVEPAMAVMLFPLLHVSQLSCKTLITLVINIVVEIHQELPFLFQLHSANYLKSLYIPHIYICMFIFINIYSVILYTILITLLYRYIICKGYVNTCLINSISKNWKIQKLFPEVCNTL